MRDPIQAILSFNSKFDPQSLRLKLSAMSASPFAFFRSTFHLFAADMLSGPFAKLPLAPSNGRIIADLHTENFGGFRAVTGKLVYDINDFDDTVDHQPYEFDLRRLMTSLIVGGTENGLRLGDTVNAAETVAHQYFTAIAAFAKGKKRQDLAGLRDPAVVRRLLKLAAAKPRDMFMKSLAEPGPKGLFEFKSGNKHFRPVDGKVRAEAERRFGFFLGHSEVPTAASTTEDLHFQDIVFRYAGKGSLGKNRYAILMRKGTDPADFKALRLIEWKDSSDSPLTAPGGANKRKESKNRNREVYRAAVAFQLTPKRWLGYVPFFGFPMQTREIGANDCRFDHRQYSTALKLEQAASVFGGITARAHLLASMGSEGPRKLVERSGVAQDRLVQRLVAFAMSYSNRVHEDFAILNQRKAELAKAWKTPPLAVSGGG